MSTTSTTRSARTRKRSGYVDFKSLKQAVSILEVLQHYGLTKTLTPKGDDKLVGRCPLHKGSNKTQFGHFVANEQFWALRRQNMPLRCRMGDSELAGHHVGLPFRSVDQPCIELRNRRF